ncbi:8-amino-7-oxononanoate synthase [Candidatus Tenderia electrophaga]|uniref:8-amino-7-oxononanoate synthase n=1 Tax=Candidatus Tenderia electrophaga TaxID=1748243 RepID=A0A0S2T9E2_9GAMM|nr:8-amino-7-oxononanoate synthase [Candidatus Tenderia electrophaga]
MRDLNTELTRLHQAGLYRQRRIMANAAGVYGHADGREVLAFCSNDYLGLANHPEVVKALQAGAERWGLGSGAAHLVNGHTTAHHALEAELAAFTNRPRALLFSTGYMTNLGVIAALCGRGDHVFEDRLNHASLLDGGLLSQARLQRYAHGDGAALDGKLAQRTTGEKLVVTDGVFSMDGDLAPLPQLAATAKRHDAWLMVDDAHGFGVLGANGGGTAEHFGLGMDALPILVGTLGKAFGSFGAFVAGSDALIEFLIQKARPYIYTTALPPAVAEATRVSLKLLQTDTWRREKLQSLIQRFRRGAEELGLTLMQSQTPIQPLLIGDNDKAVALSQALLKQGILVSAIRPPTVPEGGARLRITLSAAHREVDVDQLLTVLEMVA